jgi:hypothetical protein
MMQPQNISDADEDIATEEIQVGEHVVPLK